MLRDYCGAFAVYVNHLGLSWPKPWRKNFIELAAAVCVEQTLIVRGLARVLAGPVEAMRYVDKRIRRFLGNKRLDERALDAALACHLRFLLARLPKWLYVPVTADWTKVGETDLLWLQIPCQGRTLPLVAFPVSGRGEPDEQAWRTLAEKEVLTRLRGAWPIGFPPPVLLMDRGFDKGPLLEWLLEERWLFITRAQSNLVYDARGHVLNGSLCALPGEIRCFPNVSYTAKSRFRLHLVVSGAKDKKTGKWLQWRLVTTLPEHHLRRAPALYARRASCEQTHRDSKRGHAVSGFALGHLGRLRLDRLERLVFLASLVYSFLVLLGHTRLEFRDWLKKKHWGLSIAKLGLEALRASGKLARALARQACGSIKLEAGWG